VQLVLGLPVVAGRGHVVLGHLKVDQLPLDQVKHVAEDISLVAAGRLLYSHLRPSNGEEVVDLHVVDVAVLDEGARDNATLAVPNDVDEGRLAEDLVALNLLAVVISLRVDLLEDGGKVRVAAPDVKALSVDPGHSLHQQVLELDDLPILTVVIDAVDNERGVQRLGGREVAQEGGADLLVLSEEQVALE